jgi:hypothetical protein
MPGDDCGRGLFAAEFNPFGLTKATASLAVSREALPGDDLDLGLLETEEDDPRGLVKATALAEDEVLVRGRAGEGGWRR